MEHFTFGGISLAIVHELAHVALTELTVAPGIVAPAHRHPMADELFIGIDGILEVEVDTTWYRLGPGDCVTAPAGSLHGFRVTGEATARAHVMFAPASFVGFFRGALGPDEPEALEQVMARWGVTE